jgi:hypothetical protein
MFGRRAKKIKMAGIRLKYRHQSANSFWPGIPDTILTLITEEVAWFSEDRE